MSIYTIDDPMVSRSKEWVCDRSIAGIMASNLAVGMDACLLWVLSGKGLCDGPIIRPE